MRKLRIWPRAGLRPWIRRRPGRPSTWPAAWRSAKRDRPRRGRPSLLPAEHPRANRQVAWTPSPSSTLRALPETSVMRPVTTSPSLCSAMYSSRLVGIKLLHAETDAALLAIHFQHLRLHHLAQLQHILRMIDALLRADIADVDHALDTFGKLHERAELLQAGDRAFHHRAHRELLRRHPPTDRPAPASVPAKCGAPAWIHAEDHDFHRVARLHHIGGLAHLLATRTSRRDGSALRCPSPAPRTRRNR